MPPRATTARPHRDLLPSVTPPPSPPLWPPTASTHLPLFSLVHNRAAVIFFEAVCHSATRSPPPVRLLQNHSCHLMFQHPMSVSPQLPHLIVQRSHHNVLSSPSPVATSILRSPSPVSPLPCCSRHYVFQHLLYLLPTLPRSMHHRGSPPPRLLQCRPLSPRRLGPPPAVSLDPVASPRCRYARALATFQRPSLEHRRRRRLCHGCRLASCCAAAVRPRCAAASHRLLGTPPTHFGHRRRLPCRRSPPAPPPIASLGILCFLSVLAFSISLTAGPTRHRGKGIKVIL